MDFRDNRNNRDFLLERMVAEAMTKAGIEKEIELREYFPGADNVSHMHHFTFEKVKKDVDLFIELLERYILSKDSPKKLPPKKRATKGSKINVPQITAEEAKRVFKLGKGNKELMDLLRKLIPVGVSLDKYARDLIASIKRHEVDWDAWKKYVEAVEAAALDHSFSNKENDPDKFSEDPSASDNMMRNPY